MQVAEVDRNTEGRQALVILRQHDVKVVVAHIGGEVIPHNAVDTLTGFVIDDRRLQYLDERKCLAMNIQAQFD